MQYIWSRQTDNIICCCMIVSYSFFKKISYLVRGADEQGQLCPGGRGHHAHRPRGQCGRGIPGIQDQSIMRAQPLCTQQQRKPVISCSSNTVQCTLYSVQYSIVYSVQSGSFS